MPVVGTCSFSQDVFGWVAPPNAVMFSLILGHGAPGLGSMGGKLAVKWSQPMTAHKAVETVNAALDLPVVHVRVMWCWSADGDIQLCLFAWLIKSPRQWYPEPSDPPSWFSNALRDINGEPTATAWDLLLED